MTKDVVMYRRWVFGITSVLLLLPSLGRADYLEVRRSALLKSAPHREAATLIRLEPPVQLTLLQDQQSDGYYRAATTNGEAGWVYRTLVRRFPGDLPGTGGGDTGATGAGNTADRYQIDAGSDLVIGSWNIKWFGQMSPYDYDFVTMADFIEECDVVAIQELRGENAWICLTELITELEARNRQYQFRMSEITGYDHNPDTRKGDYTERFAYIWDSERVELKEEPKLAEMPIINHSVFRQVPFVADFRVTQGRGFDFRMLTTHTVYNAGINDVRREEIAWIRQWVIDQAQTTEQNAIAIGDFNANPPSQPTAHWFQELIPDETDFRVLMYESEEAGEPTVRTTVPTLDHSPNPRYLLEPVYDHVLVSHETSEALRRQPVTRLQGDFGVHDFDNDPWWKSHGWTRPALIKAVSDHRPIWFRLDYFAEDRD